MVSNVSRHNGASGGLLGNGSRSKGFAFDNHTESEDEDKGSDGDSTAKMTPEEAKMTEVLAQKRQEVIATLIERLGTSNKDYENCLNANMILTELSDNE